MNDRLKYLINFSFQKEQIMQKRQLTQKKSQSSKLRELFSSDREDSDLPSTLINSPKPHTILQPLKTPNVAISKGRNNAFSSRTLSVQQNKTPMTSIRMKVALCEQVLSEDYGEDPLARMVELQKQHTSSAGKVASTRKRANQTSANFGSQLSLKFMAVVEADVDRVNSKSGQILKSDRFKQNWHKKSILAVDRASSLPRGSIECSNLSNYQSQSNLPMLPDIAGSKKLAYQINIAALDNDSQYLTGSLHQKSHVKLVNQAESSYLDKNNSVLSNIGLSSYPCDNSYYHMELMEEKREEIHRIMQKRQQRARATQALGHSQDILGSNTSNHARHASSRTVNQQLELPKIGTTVRDRFKNQLAEDDSDSDSTNQKIDTGQNVTKDIELATMKRSRDKAKLKILSKSATKAKDTSLMKKKTSFSPEPFDKHRDAIQSAFESGKVAKEMKGMTELFVAKQGLGQLLIDEMSVVLESDTSSISQSPKKSIRLNHASTVRFQSKKGEKAQKNKMPELKMVKMASQVVGSVRPALQAFNKRSPNRRASTIIKGTILETSERSVSELGSQLASKYELVEGLLDKETALRVQKALKKKKTKEKSNGHDYIKKALRDDINSPDLVGNQVLSERGVKENQSDRQEFNSELDLYSEIDSVKSPNSPRRRNTLAKAHSRLMRAIPAEDSAEERGSDSNQDREGSNDEDQDYDDEEEDEYERNDALMEQRIAQKTKLVALAAAKKEQEQLCGQGLVKKIDEFVFQVSVEAGLPFSETMPTSKGGMLQFGEMSNISAFGLEESKNIDQNQNQKMIDKYFDEFRGQQAFFSICKMAKESKWTDPNVNDPRMQYFAACTKNNSVAKPILSKIIDKALVLRDLHLNNGDSEGLKDNFMMDQDLINKLYLDHNGLEDNQLANILEGFSYQRQLINLTIQGNTVDEHTVEQIANLLKRKMPDHLQELHLIHIKTMWQSTENLMQQIRSRNYLRKLSLIEVGLNDFSVVHLCEVVRTQKTLQVLDISWNKLTPPQMRPLLEILQKNRRLTSLNLAWNNIMEMKGSGDDQQDGCSDQHTKDIIGMLGKIIKHSRTLQHMNLSGTGLSAQVIYEMGTILRRSRAILSLHLSGNPGLSQENMEYLHKRIRCRPNEDVERFTRIQAVVKNVLRAAGASSNIISGINKKVGRATEFSQVHKNDPIAVNDQLVFQRMLGHKVDIAGSGQWYESSMNAVACKPHYKNECWICEGHSYCIIFWSKGLCYRMNPIVPADKTEEIRFEIDRDFGEQDDADIMYENNNVKYSQMADQVPFVCGSFTGWRYRRMLKLEEFNESFDKREDPFELAHSLGHIRKHITRQAYCNEREQKYIELAVSNEKLRLTYNWRDFFAKNLLYKRPIMFNSHLYEERPSPDGTLPDLGDSDDDDLERLGELSSSDDDCEENKIEAVEVKEVPILTREQEEEKKQAEERLKRNPLPLVPDVSRFDNIFILPVFCKPGPHQYMIKYKDTTERNQSKLLKQIIKQEKRYQAGKTQPDGPQNIQFNKQKYREAKLALKPECFFYQLTVPKRTEDMPSFVKPAATQKVVQREFDREASVFKAWRKDSPAVIKQAYVEDIKHWKGYRFIKSEEDRTDTEAVLKNYFPQLKDVFTHLAASSAWPNIGSLDFCEFASRAKITDSSVNISSVDRCFIGATLKIENSSAPQNGLRRFEFLEILVRLANIKYLETKIVTTYAEATEKLITDCVIGQFTPEPWQEFRDNQLWTMDVNDLFEANLANLKTIHGHYKTPTKQMMEIDDCVTMCTKDCHLGISEKDINFCYAYCHMTITNEARTWKKYQSLELVEFLEFLGRLAHVRFKNSSPEMASQPIVQKIETILDDLMQGFGLTRYEVNIDVLEFSESDDDY